MIIGIDPGKSGALCALKPLGAEVQVVKMPVLEKGIDAQAVRKILVGWGDGVEYNGGIDYDIDLVVIEKVHSMPKQGVASSFKFGMTYGQLQGICVGLGLPFILVTPQQWKKTILTGYDWKGHKEVAIQYVKQRFPDINLKPTERSRKDSIDMAEAVCIALYGLTTGRPSDD